MTTEHVQTKREIRELLQAAGLRPRKRFGQHFLIDGNLMRRLVESAELVASDVVLEVGGGTGGLSDLLASRVAELICVELDRDLLTILENRFRDAANVRLVGGDVLAGKHRLNDAVAELLDSRTLGDAGCMKLVANLPYQVATPLLMNLLVDYPQVRRFVFTVQAEVGERIAAGPGGKAYGPISVLCQTLCEVRVIAKLPPQAFWPEPAVASVMMCLDVAKSPMAGHAEVRGLAEFVRSTFDHRRKVLRSALGYVVDAAAIDRIGAIVELTARPEAIAVDEWLAMYRAAGRPAASPRGAARPR